MKFFNSIFQEDQACRPTFRGVFLSPEISAMLEQPFDQEKEITNAIKILIISN